MERAKFKSLRKNDLDGGAHNLFIKQINSSNKRSMPQLYWTGKFRNDSTRATRVVLHSSDQAYSLREDGQKKNSNNTTVGGQKAQPNALYRRPVFVSFSHILNEF